MHARWRKALFLKWSYNTKAIFFMYFLSEQLRAHAKTYFSRKFKREVQDDEAEQYLLNLSHLYDLFLNKE